MWGHIDRWAGQPHGALPRPPCPDAVPPAWGQLDTESWRGEGGVREIDEMTHWEILAEATRLVEEGRNPQEAIGVALARGMTHQALEEVWKLWSNLGWCRKGEEAEFVEWGVGVLRNKLAQMEEANPGGRGMGIDEMVLTVECAMGEWVGRKRGEASACGDRGGAGVADVREEG